MDKSTANVKSPGCHVFLLLCSIDIPRLSRVYATLQHWNPQVVTCLCYFTALISPGCHVFLLLCSIEIPMLSRVYATLQHWNPPYCHVFMLLCSIEIPRLSRVYATLQHYLTAFGSTLTVPLVLREAMCIDEDRVGLSEIISTIFFVSGISTILQTTIGVRLVNRRR